MVLTTLATLATLAPTAVWSPKVATCVKINSAESAVLLELAVKIARTTQVNFLEPVSATLGTLKIMNSAIPATLTVLNAQGQQPTAQPALVLKC